MALTGCCGCFNLKDGSMAVGITMLVITCLQLLGIIIGYSIIGSADAGLQQVNASTDSDLTQEQVDAARATLRIAEYIMIPALIIILVLLTINSLLVHGVRKDIKGMVLAWLICYGILFSLGSFGSVAGLFSTFVDGQALPIVLAFVGVGLAALYWYWWAVVLTHYKILAAATAGFDYSKEVMMS